MRELIPAKAYYSIFAENEVGQKILEELTAIYYDQDAFDPGNMYYTAYMAGQRSVLKFIIAKVMKGEKGEEEQEEQPYFDVLQEIQKGE